MGVPGRFEMDAFLSQESAIVGVEPFEWNDKLSAVARKVRIRKLLSIQEGSFQWWTNKTLPFSQYQFLKDSLEAV